ncbi:MAG: MFS transporter [Gammaproteobacteria bacterium]|nr:MFS transporter [Gammaproteobacteria bacterium]
MHAPADSIRFGPIWLSPGITRINVMTKFWTAFVTISVLSGASVLQGYILTEHLNIPRAQQGTVSGEISFWVEVVAILMFNPFGVLADRIGRRPVFMLGIGLIGLGYALIPFATSFEELLAYRLIYAVGSAAAAGTMATLTSDYPREDSRGIMVGITSMFNTLGAIFAAGIVARIPSVMSAQGYDAVTGGKVMYLFAAALCLITVFVAHFGLAPGTPVARHERPPVSKLIRSGLRAMRNPRISLAYACSFAARSDLVIKGLFLTLWAIQDGFNQGMNPGQAMARFGLMLIIMNGIGLLSAPLFGWFIDRVNRVTAMIVALCFASAGYLSMAVITSPLDFAMIPFFIVIQLGSGFMMKASLALVGQEASKAERGSTLAMYGMFGAVGILVFTKWGGMAYDSWAPYAPFVMVGGYQAALLVIALAIRVMAPGRAAPRSLPFFNKSSLSAIPGLRDTRSS